MNTAFRTVNDTALNRFSRRPPGSIPVIADVRSLSVSPASS